MQKKLMAVVIAAVAGAGIGAAVGYGPLLRYKSEGVLSVPMGATEYKRIAELANGADSVRQYMDVSPLPGVQNVGTERVVREVTGGDWLKPVPKISKVDAKDLPDLLLQLELEREKEQDRDQNREQNRDQNRNTNGRTTTPPPPPVYLGVQIAAIASSPADAASVTTWLGAYFRDVAAREAVRDQVARWTADNIQFADRARERRLKYQFDIEQAEARAAALKRVVASYPEAGRRDASQVVDVRKENEKFISPLAQLVGAESEAIEINGKIKKLDREAEQQAFVKQLIANAETVVATSRSGNDSVTKVSAAISDFSKKATTEAEREKISALAADISQISARFLSQARFLAKPSIPMQPERPQPLMITILGAILAALIAAAIFWREALLGLMQSPGREAKS
ncbi:MULTISPECIES: hypothetical protein [Cupriavidus]